MKKRIKEYLTRERIISILLILGLLIHLYFNINLISDKAQNYTIYDLINSFIVLVTLSLITLCMYSFFFLLVTKDAHSVEKWALRNLTQVCYFTIFLVGISKLQGYISTEQFLTSLGAITVFWYGYKRYERDRELEMLEKFNKRELTIDNLEEDLDNLANAFYFNQKGYLSDYIWKRIELKIDKLIFDFLNENLKGKNITEFLENKNISDTLAKIKYDGNFIDYFIDRLEVYIATANNHEFTQKEKNEQEKITNLIIAIYQLLNPKK